MVTSCFPPPSSSVERAISSGVSEEELLGVLDGKATSRLFWEYEEVLEHAVDAGVRELSLAGEILRPRLES